MLLKSCKNKTKAWMKFQCGFHVEKNNEIWIKINPLLMKHPYSFLNFKNHQGFILGKMKTDVNFGSKTLGFSYKEIIGRTQSVWTLIVPRLSACKTSVYLGLWIVFFVTWSGNFRMLSTKYWYDFQSPAITSPNTGIIWKLYVSYSLQN